MSIAIERVKQEISGVKQFWSQRNRKFKDWMETLVMVDALATKGLETYVSNEPMTFYNMAHYLLTKGELSHLTPIKDESALELERRARIHRGCEYLWQTIDRERQLAGSSPFIDELAFYLLILGWYSVVELFDRNAGTLKVSIWSPYDTYPRYYNQKLLSCVHSYRIDQAEAVLKAEANGWSYTPTLNYSVGSISGKGEVTLDDFFRWEEDSYYNIILIDGSPVTDWVERSDMQLLVSPVGGFPDKGAITPPGRDWRKLAGRGIFEVNEAVTLAFDRWKSLISQTLRDGVHPVTQEFAASPQATPEQLRGRGALFHYAPGEEGLRRLSPVAIPIEVQANLLELRREMQKGSFNDAVYGMVEGQPGYALSLLASSSANQILYPYMDGKHFVIAESDRFWLSNLKSSRHVFYVKGKFLEKISPPDIPEDIAISVESDVATPKDWMERATVANMLERHLDQGSIVTEVLKMKDYQAIQKKRSLDRILNHPLTQLVETIASYYSHADFLDRRGDKRQSTLFRKAAVALEAQLGVPPPGSAKPEAATEAEKLREEGAPARKTPVAPEISPPEAQGGFTPEQLRRSIGRGVLREV